MKTKRQIGRKIISFLITMAMVLGMMRGMSLTAYADQPPVTYLNASGETETCYSYNAVTNSNKTLKDGWNVVTESVTISSSQDLWDELNIILCDNATLTVATSEVAISSGGNFNIYAQSTGDSMGELVASSQDNNALESKYSHITINGGRITATSNNSYGIKGANGVSINGGIVTASGGNGAFGIWNSVTNSIPGIGWTNTDGTEGKTLIEANQSEKLSYKKAQFPAKTADVTFKVVNGSWSDGSVEDKTASLFGPEDTDLKLAPSDIPEVGKAKDESFISGSWDVTPSADTVITGATTYTYTFTQKAAIVTKEPVSNTLTYTGAAQELVTAGKAEGGTMNYAIGKDDKTAPTDGWSASIPTATDAGTYYVWYKAVGDDDHSDSKSGCVEVTIAAKQESASVKKTPKAITGLIYNGSAQKLVEAGEAENGTLYYAVTETDKEPESSAYSTDVPSKTNAGTYYVWYKAVGNEGYGDSEVGKVKVEIADNEEDGDELPKLLEITKNSITVETIDGFEFSINNGTDWQDSGKFEGLESCHEYTIQIRKKGSEEILDKIYAKTNDSDKVTETKEQFRKTIDDGTGIVRAETRVREDVPVGAIDNIDIEFAKAIMSDSELDDVKGGKSCLIYLDVSGLDEDENSDIGDTVREKQPGASFGMIFDISLWKKIGDAEAGKVSTSFKNNPLKITMAVPEELQSENRMFYVGCQHENDDGTKETEFIETTTNEDGTETSFKITGCSTYSLYYTDPVKESSDSSSASTAAGYVTRQRVDATKLMSLPSGVKIKYTTSDKKLAKVSRKGVIKIQKKAGTVTITAKNKKTGATIDSCTLVIEKPVIKQKKLVVTGVTAGNSDSWKTRSANEFLGNTTVKPQWYSSKPSVAEVNKDTGEVTIKGKGKAKIYAVFGSDALKSKFGTRKAYKYKIVSKN
ncbi:hypothetical protein QYZ88_007295 [Lachnospiraceae bacterium C1.1]|nr:hypothetical protein [Lachnospiraceae bacterium C1.1]